MEKSPLRLIVTIAIIIVVFWAIGMIIKLAGWFLNLLLPVAAAVLIVAIIISWRNQPKKYRSTNRQAPLKITRDTSDKK